MSDNVPVVRKRRRRRPSERSLEIFRLHLVLGKTMREIAKDFGISVPRVSVICRTVSTWLNEYPVESNIPAIRAQHDQVFKWLIRESVVEWQKSKKSFKTTKAKMVRGRVDKDGNPLPDLVTSEQIEREQFGDPRYIQVVNDLMKSQRAMWGADEPKRTEISGPEGAPITIATVLKIVGDNPPPVPELEEHPANVLDLDDALREIDAMSVGGGEVVDVESREPEAE